jgi:hypothetical protein
VINDSEGIATPHEAFCRVVAVNHPQKPDVGKEVTSVYWFREKAADDPDSIACSNALKFLSEKVADGKIGAQGIRPQWDAPGAINLSELRTGNLKVFDGTLECHIGGQGSRLYRSVFLSMADLNRELGVPAAKQIAPTKVSSDAKLATGPDFKHDWEGALIEVMAFLHSEGVPDRPKPIVDTMLAWFQSQPSGEPGRSKLYEKAKRILDRLKSV